MDDTVLPKLQELGVEPVETAASTRRSTTRRRFRPTSASSQNGSTPPAPTRCSSSASPARTGRCTWSTTLPTEAPVHGCHRRARVRHERGDQRHIDPRRIAIGRELRSRPGALGGGGRARVRRDAQCGRCRKPGAVRVRRQRPSNQPYQAGFFACPDVALMQAWLEAAGENLNYGTLEAALDGFSCRFRATRASARLVRHPRPTATRLHTSSVGTIQQRVKVVELMRGPSTARLNYE